MSINCWSTLSARKPYTNNVVLFLMFNLLDALHWSTKFLNSSPPLHQPHRMPETDVWMFNAVKFVFNIFFHPFNCCLLLILSLIDRCYARSVSELYSMNQILLTFLIVPAQMFCGFCGKAKLSWASHRSLVPPRRLTLILFLLFIIDVCESITKIGFVIDLRHQNQLMSLGISSTFHSSLVHVKSSELDYVRVDGSNQTWIFADEILHHADDGWNCCFNYSNLSQSDKLDQLSIDVVVMGTRKFDVEIITRICWDFRGNLIKTIFSIWMIDINRRLEFRWWTGEISSNHHVMRNEVANLNRIALCACHEHG